MYKQIEYVVLFRTLPPIPFLGHVGVEFKWNKEIAVMYSFYLFINILYMTYYKWSFYNIFFVFF